MSVTIHIGIFEYKVYATVFGLIRFYFDLVLLFLSKSFLIDSNFCESYEFSVIFFSTC